MRAFKTLVLSAAFGVFHSLFIESAPAPQKQEADAWWLVPRCSMIQVLSPQKKRFPHPMRFSATQILDLEFRVSLPGRVTGEHRLDVKVYAPDQQLYQTLTVPFRGPDEAPFRLMRRKLSGHLQPIAEVESEAAIVGRDRRTIVTVVLPVAGTSIVASSLYGQWSAAAFLDESPRPCGPAARFVIAE